jgi:hypothetical protein
MRPVRYWFSPKMTKSQDVVASFAPPHVFFSLARSEDAVVLQSCLTNRPKTNTSAMSRKLAITS